VAAVHAISTLKFELFDKQRSESESGPQVAAVRAKLLAGEAAEGWSLHEELLLFRGKIFLPDASSLWPQLLSFAHDSGHEGIEKTVNHLRASFYSHHILRRVCDYVRGCEVCQRNKMEHLHPAGLL
jgi:hypothetical protein